MRAALALALLLAFSTCTSLPALAHDARQAVIVSVYDCDTFTANVVTLSVGSELSVVTMPVRVRGVSAPERTGAERALGLECRAQATGKWLQPGDRVTLVGPFTWDPRRRLVASVLLPNGRDLAAELVRGGYALPWDYPKQARPAFDPAAPYPLDLAP